MDVSGFPLLDYVRHDSHMRLFNYINAAGPFCLTGSPCPAGISNLRCEDLVNPLAVHSKNPRLSWIITSSVRGEKLTGYSIG